MTYSIKVDDLTLRVQSSNPDRLSNISWINLCNNDNSLMEDVFKSLFPNSDIGSRGGMIDTLKDYFIPRTNQLYILGVTEIPKECLDKLTLSLPNIVVLSDRYSNHYIASINQEKHSLFNIAFAYTIIGRTVPQELMTDLSNTHTFNESELVGVK